MIPDRPIPGKPAHLDVKKRPFINLWNSKIVRFPPQEPVAIRLMGTNTDPLARFGKTVAPEVLVALERTLQPPAAPPPKIDLPAALTGNPLVRPRRAPTDQTAEQVLAVPPQPVEPAQAKKVDLHLVLPEVSETIAHDVSVDMHRPDFPSEAVARLTIDQPNLGGLLAQTAASTQDPEGAMRTAAVLYEALTRQKDADCEQAKRKPIVQKLSHRIAEARRTDERFANLDPDVLITVQQVTLDTLLLDDKALLEQARLLERELSSPIDPAWLTIASYTETTPLGKYYKYVADHPSTAISQMRNGVATTNFRIQYLNDHPSAIGQSRPTPEQVDAEDLILYLMMHK